MDMESQVETTEERIQLNELSIPVRRSSRRKSVGITVDRDGSVYASAPVGCELESIAEYVRSRTLWIYKKLAHHEALTNQKTTKKQFVDGSCFWYLGQALRLRVVDEMPNGKNSEPLQLVGEWFLLHRDAVAGAKDLFRKWYVEQGRNIVDRVIELYGMRVAVPEKVDLRDIGFRWGSCTKEGKVLISWRAIQLPMDALEYVIVHEMVHLLYHNHDEDYWQQLHKVMPDYERRKEWLAKNGDQFAIQF